MNETQKWCQLCFFFFFFLTRRTLCLSFFLINKEDELYFDFTQRLHMLLSNGSADAESKSKHKLNKQQMMHNLRDTSKSSNMIVSDTKNVCAAQTVDDLNNNNNTSCRDNDNESNIGNEHLDVISSTSSCVVKQLHAKINDCKETTDNGKDPDNKKVKSANEKPNKKKSSFADIATGKSSVNSLTVKKDISPPCVTEDTGQELSTFQGPQPPYLYSVYSKEKKVCIFLIITFCGFLGPLAGNIFIPALPFLQTVFAVDDTTINATVSVFMAVFSVGPIIWGMYADSYGRKKLYIASVGIALVANVLLSVVPAKISALYVLRIVQAFGTSGVIPLGLGTVRDIVDISHRGRAVSVFMIGPNAGPVLAPIIAGLILKNGDYSWRWLFGTLSIMTGVAFVAVLWFLPETLRSLVGNGDKDWESKSMVDVNKKSNTVDGKKVEHLENTNILVQEKNDHHEKRDKLKKKLFGVKNPVNDSEAFLEMYPKAPKPHLKTFFNMIKDVRILLNSFCNAIVFAVYYGFSVTFAYRLKEEYKLNNLQVGAAYCCPGVALIIGTLSSGYFSDRVLNHFKENSKNGIYAKENRLILQLFGLLVSCCGSVGYGWSIEKKFNLVIVLVFAAFSAFGMTWCSNASITYMIDVKGRQAATAISINNSFRNAAAAISAAIINKLTRQMGFGWCFTGLGVCVFLAEILLIFLIAKGNQELREKVDLECTPEKESS